MSQPYAGRDGSSTGTTCPFCETETGIARDPEGRLGRLSPTELETLVRNEWRRRLGPGAYRRGHPGALVRALAAHALAPADADLDEAVDDALWREVAMLESWGLGRRAMWRELLSLSQALWDVLCRTDLEFERSRTLMERMDRKIHDTLGWPERHRPGEEFLVEMDEADSRGGTMSQTPRNTRGAQEADAPVAGSPIEVRDEVCGMRFPVGETVATAEYGGKTYHFCAARCRRLFLEHPTWYVPAAEPAG